LDGTKEQKAEKIFAKRPKILYLVGTLTLYHKKEVREEATVN
jgi:hypothetical protein